MRRLLILSSLLLSACTDAEHRETSERTELAAARDSTGAEFERRQTEWRAIFDTTASGERHLALWRLGAARVTSSGGREHRPTLVIFCDTRDPDVVISAGIPVQNSAVRLQFGSDPGTAEVWNAQATGEGMSAPNARAFIERMLAVDTLRVEFTPAGETSVAARFVVAGLDAHMAQFEPACGWKPVSSGRYAPAEP